MYRLLDKRVFVFFLTAIFAMPCSLNARAQTDGERYKLIRTIEQDTTGDMVCDKVKIFADTQKQGYQVEIEQHDTKTYRLKPAAQFDDLAQYKPFWNLNMQIMDINGDSVPEIIIWGSMTHENPIHIFRWDGSDYKIVYSGFDTGFEFKDITGDNVPELVIYDRIYGTGDERIYYQWKNHCYKRIYYEVDGNDGYDQIQYVLNSFCALHGDPSKYNAEHFKDYLENNFTDRWLSNDKNADNLKKFGQHVFSIQVIKYLNNQREYNAQGESIGVTWHLKVRAFMTDGERIYPRELLMTATTRYVDNLVWKIDAIHFDD